MAGHEVDARSAERAITNNKPEERGLIDHIWSAFKHQSGISAVEAVAHSEPVQNMLNDFRIVDDGKGAFAGAARKHVEKELNGTQMKALEEERDQYRKDLFVSGLPFFGKDLPEKGGNMKEFDAETNSVIDKAEKRVQDQMKGDEMKAYLNAKKLYEAEQVAAMVTIGVGMRHVVSKPKELVEYEQKVLKEIDRTSIQWDEPKGK